MSRFFDESRGPTTTQAFRRRAASVRVAVLLLAGICGVIAHFLLGSGSNPPGSQRQDGTFSRVDPSKAGSVQIRKPAGPPRVNTGLLDPHGQSVTIACNTCHGNWTANAEARVGRKLERFHQNLDGSHGSLACMACHNANDGYASLHLADVRTLAFPEVMQLCAQCHGPQYRDYQHGSHGGMTGYWDLRRGPRERNNCIDCHDPHSPRYPLVMPMRGPNDRFLTPSK